MIMSTVLIFGLIGTSLINHPNNPIFPGAVEESFIMDGNRVDNWYHEMADNCIYYAYSDDPMCETWTVGNGGNPVLGNNYVAPYVFKVDNIYYMAAIKNGELYLLSSANKTTWAEVNGGNPILRRSTNPSDWNYYLANPAITVINGYWHLLIEGKNGVGGGYETHYSLSSFYEGPNFNTRLTTNPILSGITGNSFLIHVPDRNAFLVIHGTWNNPSNPYWEIQATNVLLSSDLSNPTNWNLSRSFKIYQQGIHIADPTLIFAPTNSSHPWKMMFGYNYNQSEGYRAYSNLGINEFYDLVTGWSELASILGANYVETGINNQNPSGATINFKKIRIETITVRLNFNNQNNTYTPVSLAYPFTGRILAIIPSQSTARIGNLIVRTDSQSPSGFNVYGVTQSYGLVTGFEEIQCIVIGYDN